MRPGSPWAAASCDSSFWKVKIYVVFIKLDYAASLQRLVLLGFNTSAICLVWQNLHLVSSHSSLCPTWQRALDWQPGYQAHPSLVSPEAGRGPVWISQETSSHLILPSSTVLALPGYHPFMRVSPVQLCMSHLQGKGKPSCHMKVSFLPFQSQLLFGEYLPYSFPISLYSFMIFRT